MILALLVVVQTAAGPGSDPFEFFRPEVQVSAGEVRRLDEGTPIARVLPGTGREVAVLAAVPVAIDADRLIAWTQCIEELKRGPYVSAIGRFSMPPRIEDLAGLSLDDDELSQIRRCRVKDCGLKLSDVEMSDLRKAGNEAGSEWKPAVQQAFRRVILKRVETYLGGGLDALRPYDDQNTAESPAHAFSTILEHSGFLARRLPEFADYLRRFPQGSAVAAGSFVYWSIERIAKKPIVSVTHVSVARATGPGQPLVLVAGTQLLATHYMTGSLGLTVLLPGRSGSHNYLAHLNRSELDVLKGPFSGLLRWFIQRRLKSEASAVLRALRDRLESGVPGCAKGRAGGSHRRLMPRQRP
jgi:hypothetical protein